MNAKNKLLRLNGRRLIPSVYPPHPFPGAGGLSGFSPFSYTESMRSCRALFWLAILSPAVLLFGCRTAGKINWAEGFYDSLWAVVDDSVHKNETPYERDERMWREFRE